MILIKQLCGPTSETSYSESGVEIFLSAKMDADKKKNMGENIDPLKLKIITNEELEH